MIETIWENTNNKKIPPPINSSEKEKINFSKLIPNTDENKQFHLPNNQIHGLKLTNKFISDKDLQKHFKQLKGNTEHKALFLGKNNITDIGFNTLSNELINNKSIQHLILSHNKIQFNEFAKAGLADLLKINRHIGWLVLNNNEIENKGAINLALALKENKSILHLILSNNKIKDEGLKGLLDTLKDHPRIESLFIANNQFNSISINYLIDFIIKNKTIRRIDITGNFEEKGEKLNQLKKIAATNNIRLIL